MGELSSRRPIPKWVISAVVGVLIYWLPTGYLLISAGGDIDHIYIINSSSEPLVIFSYAAVFFWPSFGSLLIDSFGINFYIPLDNLFATVTVILSSSLIWSALGGLFTRRLGFPKGLRVLIVWEVGALCAIGFLCRLVMYMVD